MAVGLLFVLALGAAPASPDGAPDPRPAYPPAAAAQKVSGRVELSCRITRDGRVDRCQVVSESPAGLGFGEAALRLSERFRMKSMARDGKSVANKRIIGGIVRIPVRFDPPPDIDPVGTTLR